MLFEGAVTGMTQAPLGVEGGIELDELGVLGTMEEDGEEGVAEDDGEDGCAEDDDEDVVETTITLDDEEVLEVDCTELATTTAPF